MTSDVYKILYCSKNLIEGENAKRDAEITQILQTARRKNKQQNVTGALLFNSGYFAQALEGPRLAIETIFERIQRDPRHGDVTVLSSQTGGHRDFPEWSMAYVAPPGGPGSAGTAAVATDTALLHPAASADEVLGLLRSLVIQED
jgi:blue light- and temperature-responsive anti-repressor